MTDPWARPPQQPGPPQPAPGVAPTPTGFPPGSAPGVPPEEGSSLPAKFKKLFSDPLSIGLVVVIVVALSLAGALGGELYARSRADSIVAGVVECVVQDDATASFGVLPPFLLQHMTGHYTNIRIETAGNQVREAKGMKVHLDINDVRLEDTATSSGTVGSLVANISWSTEGIKQTIQGAIPLVGSFVTGVSTNPSAGTIELEGALGSITARPQVVNGGIALQVQQVTGLGFTLPRETVQPALDAFTATLTEDYPMNIKADSVQVTETGVVSQFSTRNASMPKQTEDPCFGVV
ncbi:LmeA family phospholipid-binding protein [Mycolicibacterium sp.]|uniref:LmeA family phospholipid-binding protein n=1 Tax=Mycolicibacterium sp. TaxID=2320850 RepID=UPI003D14F95D